MPPLLEEHLLERFDVLWRGQLERADELSHVAAFLPNPSLQSMALLTRCAVALWRDDAETAKQLAQQVITSTAREPDARLAAVCIGAARLIQGRPDKCVEEVYAAAGGSGLPDVPASTRPWISELLVRAEIERGRIDEANEVARTITAPGLDKLSASRVALARQRPRKARTLADAAIFLFSEQEMRLFEGEARLVAGLASAALFEREAALASLGVAKLIAEGSAAKGLAHRVNNAMRSIGARLPRPRQRPGDLTVREREIVELLGHGLTNRQIGERLHLSPRTVQSHLSHLFGKLHVTNRAALVAVSHGT
jgi:DNA-binding CsgD family transcriptional regulator